jgi:hypothetical protein
MRNTSRTRGAVWLLACATLAAVAGTTLIQYKPSMPTASGGRNTNARIISRSEPLFQALIPGGSRIETVAAPVTNFNSSGQSVRQLNIDRSDPATGDTAHLLWNVDTGELMRASRVRRLDRSGRFNESSRRTEAVGLAWDWFHALKIERPAEEWRIVGTLKKPYAQWDVYFRSGGRCTIVTVNTCSGQLVQAICTRRPDAKMVWVPLKLRVAS